MYKIAFSLILLCPSFHSLGQTNLISTDVSHIKENFPKNWYNPVPKTSPDYYQGTSDFAHIYPVDRNCFGLMVYSANENYREYITTKTQYQLVQGLTYEISFSISNGMPISEGIFSDYGIYGIKKFGVLVSVDSLMEKDKKFIYHEEPTYVVDSFIYNKQWERYKFIFQADTTSVHYLTFGNFSHPRRFFIADSARQDSSLLIKHGEGVARYCYYFIDDVSVIPSSLIPKDTIPEIIDTLVNSLEEAVIDDVSVIPSSLIPKDTIPEIIDTLVNSLKETVTYRTNEIMQILDKKGAGFTKEQQQKILLHIDSITNAFLSHEKIFDAVKPSNKDTTQAIYNYISKSTVDVLRRIEGYIYEESDSFQKDKLSYIPKKFCRDTMNLPSLVFKKSSSDFLDTNSAHLELDKVRKFFDYMQDSDTLIIHGHTAYGGEKKKMFDLSKKRAKKAVDYLISHGVDSTRVLVRPHGYQHKKALLHKQDPKNRRIEIDIPCGIRIKSNSEDKKDIIVPLEATDAFTEDALYDKKFYEIKSKGGIFFTEINNQYKIIERFPKNGFGMYYQKKGRPIIGHWYKIKKKDSDKVGWIPSWVTNKAFVLKAADNFEVEKGETLEDLAKKYDLSIEWIRFCNPSDTRNIGNAEVFPGEKIFIKKFKSPNE